MSEVIELRRAETFAEKVAANIRAEAARRGINQSALARALGMSQAAASDRFRGRTPWTLNEIEAVARVLRTTTSTLCAIRDSNPEPAGLEPRTADVISLAAHRRARRPLAAVPA